MRSLRQIKWTVVAIVFFSLVVFGVGAAPLGATPPTNDDFANETALVAGGGSLTADNTGATKEAGEPFHAGDQGGASLWYTWTPGFSGDVSVDTTGSAIDTLLAVYTGTSVSALTTVASNDDVTDASLVSRVCFHADASTTYRVAVDGYADDEGAITLTYGSKADSAPCPTLPPTISGPAAPKVGDVLSLGAGSYVGIPLSPPFSIAHQWERCVELLCTDIAGETNTVYTVQQQDVGTAIRLHETLTTPSGSASNDAAPTAAVSLTPATHTNGRIYFVTKTLVSSFGIDSMLPDGTDLKQVRPPVASPNNSTMPAVSPDGSIVAFVNFGNGSDIETMNADGSNVHDLGVAGTWPSWSPDGSRIAFISGDGIDSVDRNGNEVLLVPLASGSTGGPIDWSPDGSKIAFGYHFPGKSDLDIAIVSASGMGSITQLTTSPADDHDPAWSPTGDRIAFERGPLFGGITDGDLYVMNADGSNQTLLYDGNPTNATPAVNMARDGVDWSPDGTKILFSINSGFGASQLYTIPAGGGAATQLPGDGYQNVGASWGVFVAPTGGSGGSSGGGGGGGGGGGSPNMKLTVSLAGGAPSVPVGQGALLIFNMTEQSGNSSLNTDLTVQLSGLTYVSAQAERGPGCSVSGSTVTCPQSFFPGGSSYRVLLTVLVTSSSPSASGSLVSNPADSDPSDDKATWTLPAPPAPTPTPVSTVGTTTTPTNTTSVPTVQNGTARADHLVGTAKADTLNGRAGNDILDGRAGNDTLNGGTGNDSLFGGAGNDKLTGGPGKDRMFGGTGNDTIFARDGSKDTVDCGPGIDKVTADKVDAVAKNCEHVHRVGSL